MPDVRFGSKADICSAKGHVRFAPNSDRESEFPQTGMSALPPKADMCGAATDVRFGPIADIERQGMRVGPLRPMRGHRRWRILFMVEAAERQFARSCLHAS